MFVWNHFSNTGWNRLSCCCSDHTKTQSTAWSCGTYTNIHWHHIWKFRLAVIYKIPSISIRSILVFNSIIIYHNFHPICNKQLLAHSALADFLLSLLVSGTYSLPLTSTWNQSHQSNDAGIFKDRIIWLYGYTCNLSNLFQPKTQQFIHSSFSLSFSSSPN